MNEAVLEINVTEFKAKCLTLFKALEARRYDKVVVTRRGRPIAELTPAMSEVPDPYGCAKGTSDHPARRRPDRACPGGHSRSGIGRGTLLLLMVLLDTCAVIWVVEREPMSQGGLVRHSHAAVVGVVRFAGFRLGGRVAGQATARASVLSTIGASVVRTTAGAAGVRPVPLYASRCGRGVQLPGNLHGDPADRLLIATARELKVPLVTRDRRILDYAAQGHVDAIAC